ncbi:MAG: glutamate synthase subunit beta [Eubacterium sp.]|nr:glutamate synthase subunit beta [Eubacterium sp.]
MGKITGFMEYEREDNRYVPVQDRIRNYDELYVRLPEDERRRQAARCMNCGVPFCQSAMQLSGMVTGCPLHNLIPEWNDLLYRGDLKHALERLLKTSSFPEFTGRVCPALCEKACILGMIDKPVATHDNELFLIEEGFRKGLVQPRPPKTRSGKKVAVIGSGPAGLAAADMLNRRGHTVTVYERDDRIGGLLTYGIPNQKLPKEVVARRAKLMEEEGVIFRTGCNVGIDVPADEILKNYDAVLLSCGAKHARPLAAKNIENAKGVYFAVDYLTSAAKHLLDGKKFIDAKGKNVVIVGGGDTGNDCVGTSIRQGAASVVQLEMMPEPPIERTASNPWPEWPKVKKTDYGQIEAEGVFGQDPRVYQTTVEEVICDKRGNLKAVRTVKVAFENGKLTAQEGSQKEIPCQILIIAAGFLGAENYTPDAFKAPLDNRNRVKTREDSTQVDGKVFSAGDMRRGQSLVVWAIAEGRKAAKEIDGYLLCGHI